MSDFEIDIKEGQPYPGWHRPFESSILNVTSEGLHLLVSIPFPRPVDLEDFKNLNNYGIYRGEFPLIIWKFGENFLLPTPLNPRFEYQESPDETDMFFSKIRTRFSRALIDTHGIIRVLRETSLKPNFIETLHGLWKDSDNDWSTYNNWLVHIFQIPTHKLWKQAEKFET